MGVLEDLRSTTQALIVSFESIKLLPFSSSNTIFLSHWSSFVSLVDQLDDKIKELEARERTIRNKEYLITQQENINIRYFELERRERVQKSNNLTEQWQIKQQEQQIKQHQHHITQQHSQIEKQDNQIEQQENQIKQQQNQIKQLELQMKEVVTSIDKKYCQVKEREIKCTRRELRIKEAEKQVAIMVKKWDFKLPPKFHRKTRTPIKLVVSGTVFSTSIELLLQFKNRYFEELISENNHQILSTGEMHLDRNPIYFGYLLGYMLRTAMGEPILQLSSLSINKDEMGLYLQEFNDFDIPLTPLLRHSNHPSSFTQHPDICDTPSAD